MGSPNSEEGTETLVLYLQYTIISLRFQYFRWRRGENSDSSFQPTVAQRKASPGHESLERIGKIGPETELSDILHKPASKANPVTSCIKLKIECVKLTQKNFT
jgi:hypothetical protein